jgi:hypothetical protein
MAPDWVGLSVMSFFSSAIKCRLVRAMSARQLDRARSRSIIRATRAGHPKRWRPKARQESLASCRAAGLGRSRCRHQQVPRDPPEHRHRRFSGVAHGAAECGRGLRSAIWPAARRALVEHLDGIIMEGSVAPAPNRAGIQSALVTPLARKDATAFDRNVECRAWR